VHRVLLFALLSSFISIGCNAQKFDSLDFRKYAFDLGTGFTDISIKGPYYLSGAIERKISNRWAIHLGIHHYGTRWAIGGSYSIERNQIYFLGSKYRFKKKSKLKPYFGFDFSYWLTSYETQQIGQNVRHKSISGVYGFGPLFGIEPQITKNIYLYFEAGAGVGIQIYERYAWMVSTNQLLGYDKDEYWAPTMSKPLAFGLRLKF